MRCGNGPHATRADQTGGELIEVLLADEDRARGVEPRDERGTFRRCVGEGRAAGGGRNARHLDVVVHAVRQAE